MNPQVPQQPVTPQKSGNGALPWIMLGTVVVLVLLALVLLVIGISKATNSSNVSSSDSSSPSATAVTQPRNVCQQLTAAVVSQAAGKTLRENPKATDNNGGQPTSGYSTSTSSCDYNSEDLVSRVTITAYFPGGKDYPDTAIEHHKSIKSGTTESGGTVEQVSGLGDDAYWDATTGQLSALKGDSDYQVQVYLVDKTQDKPVAESLMRTMLTQN